MIQIRRQPTTNRRVLRHLGRRSQQRRRDLRHPRIDHRHRKLDRCRQPLHPRNYHAILRRLRARNHNAPQLPRRRPNAKVCRTFFLNTSNVNKKHHKLTYSTLQPQWRPNLQPIPRHALLPQLLLFLPQRRQRHHRSRNNTLPARHNPPNDPRRH